MWHDETDKERFVFSDLTAKDKKTGLMWTRDADMTKEGETWKDALKFIEKLNKEKYAGYSGWRLPSEDELVTLIDYAKGEGYKEGLRQILSKVGFRNVQAFNYWSSSTYGGNPTYAWLVGMRSGVVYGVSKTYTYYVWPVRAGQ